MKTNKLTGYRFFLFYALLICTGIAWGAQYGDGYVYINKNMSDFFKKDNLQKIDDNLFKLHVKWEYTPNGLSTNLIEDQPKYIKHFSISGIRNEGGDSLSGFYGVLVSYKEGMLEVVKNSMSFYIKVDNTEQVTYKFIYYPNARIEAVPTTMDSLNASIARRITTTEITPRVYEEIFESTEPFTISSNPIVEQPLDRDGGNTGRKTDKAKKKD